MNPEQYIKRGGTCPADELHHTSTAWYYGGAWIVYELDEGGRKHVITQAMDPAHGLDFIAKLRKLQTGA